MKHCVTVLGLLISIMLFSQIKNPVQVSFSAEKVSKDSYDLVAFVTIEPGWHVYSLDGEEGPVYTSFSVHTSFEGKWVAAKGIREKGQKISKYEDVFQSYVSYFEDKVQFITRIKKLKAFSNMCVPVQLEYMACNEKECLPPKTKSGCILLK